MSQKNPVTPPGIDPGTVRLVAQGLNHYATPGPRTKHGVPAYCRIPGFQYRVVKTAFDLIKRSPHRVTMPDLGSSISIMNVQDVGVSETPVPSLRMYKALHSGIQ